MLSHQIYTPKYSNIQNIFATSQERSIKTVGVQEITEEDVSSKESIDQFTYETPNVVAATLYPGIPQFTYETPNVVAATLCPGIPQSLLMDTTICKIQCPTSPQNKVKHEIDTISENEQAHPIPIFQYTTKLSTQLFDPTIINTPPSEFMNHLKSRLDGYYSASS